MPADVAPALAGQAEPPVDALLSRSKVHSAIGTFRLARVFQSTRQNDACARRSTAARKMSAPLACAAPAGYVWVPKLGEPAVTAGSPVEDVVVPWSSYR